MAPLVAQKSRDFADTVTNASNGKKDEFGRDIRSPSPRTETTVTTDSTTISPAFVQSVGSAPAAVPSNHDQSLLSSSIAANTSPPAASTTVIANKDSSEPGLESFNIATFDFTSPASWESLGKMWLVTNGYMPTTEQLMQLVLSFGAGAVAEPVQPVVNQEQWQWNGDATSHNWRGRGRGGFPRGRGRGGRDFHQHRQHEETEAIVLGGGDDETPMLEDDTGTSGGPGGRMQRVGDKWVFVRHPGLGVA